MPMPLDVQAVPLYNMGVKSPQTFIQYRSRSASRVGLSFSPVIIGYLGCRTANMYGIVTLLMKKTEYSAFGSNFTFLMSP